jgi:phage baseplate assembly protein W
MSKAFLGIGTAFPLALNGSALARAEFEESVRQSILIILGTAPGERIMRPDFGCGIHDLVFESAIPTTIGRVQQTVHQTLMRLEPRIDVISVDVETGGDGNVLLINIEYQVRATNNAFNLVYPFYLQPGAP